MDYNLQTIALVKGNLRPSIPSRMLIGYRFKHNWSFGFINHMLQQLLREIAVGY